MFFNCNAVIADYRAHETEEHSGSPSWQHLSQGGRQKPNVAFASGHLRPASVQVLPTEEKLCTVQQVLKHQGYLCHNCNHYVRVEVRCFYLG